MDIARISADSSPREGKTKLSSFVINDYRSRKHLYKHSYLLILFALYYWKAEYKNFEAFYSNLQKLNY